SLLIVSLALCFLMVMFANTAGFSSALGAFIMGSILAETTKAEKIDHLLKPVKDLFGAIFFVSVGMLLNPEMIVQHYIPVLLAVIVLLFGKPLFVIIGSLISGQPLKIAVQSGMSLSQIGEFSFIIATLGLSLNVTSEFLYPVAVTVSVITTFTTPFMIRFSPFVSEKLESILPDSWNKKLNRYSVGAQNVAEESEWKKLIRFYVINVIIFSVVIITVILLSTSYLLPIFREYSVGREITALLTLMILAPFLWALAFRRTQKEAYAKVWSQPLQRGPLIVLILTRIVLMLVYIGFLFYRLYSPAVAIVGVICTLIVLALFYKRIRNFYSRIELRFLSNLNEREESQSVNQELAPWDTHLSSFVLEPQSPYVGKTLQESKIREEFGVNIAVIERGDLILNVPSRDERLYPHDILSVIGTDDQLKKFREYLDSSKPTAADPGQKQKVSLQHFIVQKNSILLGKTIRHSGIREKTKGLVVGIERKGQHILNPESDFEFELNDIVWVVGNERRILVLSREQVKQT
ncbi:MAG: cation:proton antiporter, partial [Bacteroidia bacterium]|nr:cation:proton antiporter [Bacteroidia bacterium]